MKNSILLFLLCSILTVKAQISDSSTNETAEIPNVFRLQKQFLFIDITENLWLNPPANIKNEFFSGGINLNFLYQFSIIPSVLGIAPGLTYSVASVKTNSIYQYSFISDSSEILYTSLEPYNPSLYEKSKLSTSFIGIPIELHVHTKSNEKGRSFLIAPGFRAGLLVGNFWKLKYTGEQPGQSRIKVYCIENLTPFSYGLSLRLMYYKFGIYGYYSLSNLFESGRGPAIMPVSLGITISPF
ncbi:MAG: outer membrane beta-barrel protein [Chitinophagales bacterium]|nr:outer membrane beta-barrel protein [Chitinophagales bacterium]